MEELDSHFPNIIEHCRQMGYDVHKECVAGWYRHSIILWEASKLNHEKVKPAWKGFTQ